MSKVQSFQKYGLIGKSLSHSFSQHFFTQKFEKENIQAIYENIELQDEKSLAAWFSNTSHDFKGVNVTIPYKEKVIPFLDDLSDEAKAIGAVNTIKFENGKKMGYNTDAYGFGQSIKPFFRNVHEKALILGNGGASKAVAYYLQKLGVSVCFISRNPLSTNQFSYEEVNERMVNAFKLIIQTTPVGTYPNIHDKPDFPIHLVGKDHLVIDLIYNPETTPFLQLAKEQGADILNGLSMLQHQALQSWEIWNK